MVFGFGISWASFEFDTKLDGACVVDTADVDGAGNWISVIQINKQLASLSISLVLIPYLPVKPYIKEIKCTV